MIREIGRKKILWVISAVFALGAASFGVLNQGIYDGIVDPRYLSGTVAQDLMVVFASLVLLVLSLRVKEEDTRQHLVILGILGFYFYAYGIFIIERFFNMFYLVYLAIFGVSFYGIVYTVASFEGDTFSGVSLSGGVKKFISGYMIFSALMFSMIWISSIIPLMQTGTKPEFAWSIYIIDLCFTLPLLVIVAVMALRNSKFGIAMMLPLNIVGFSILAPLVLGEILKPTLYGLEMIVEETLMYAGISSIFLISVILLLRNLKINSN